MPPLFLAAAVGLAAGVLVNYLADVLPIRRRLARPVCTSCGTEQPWAYTLFWTRRCRACGNRRGLRTWAVLLAFPLLFAGIQAAGGDNAPVPFYLAALLCVYFGVVAVIDIELRLILHPVSAAGVLIGLAAGGLLYGFWRSVAGGLAGFMTMLALYSLGTLFTRLTRRLQGENEEVALGFGDVNLAGVLGLMLGWPNIWMGLIISVLVAGLASALIMGVMLLLRRYRAFTAIPYGPFLIAGAALVLFTPALAQRLLAWISPLFWLRP